MNCIFCNGEIEYKKVTFIYENDDEYIFVKNVPAEVCTKCGEKTYSPEITDKLLRFADNKISPIEKIEVPLFDYSAQFAVA
jgi:HTH-type transcriptional regulator / antitoxin MqsA